MLIKLILQLLQQEHLYLILKKVTSNTFYLEADSFYSFDNYFNYFQHNEIINYPKTEVINFPFLDFINSMFLDGMFYGVILLSVAITTFIYKTFKIQYWKTISFLQIAIMTTFLLNDLILKNHTILTTYSITAIGFSIFIIMLSFFFNNDENFMNKIATSSFLNGTVFISILSIFIYLSQRNFLTPTFRGGIDTGVITSFIAMQISIAFLRRKKTYPNFIFFLFATITLFSFTLTSSNIFRNTDQITIFDAILKLCMIFLCFNLISKCYKMLQTKREKSLQNEINNQQYILMLKHYNSLLTEEKKQKESIFKNQKENKNKSKINLGEQLKLHFKLTEREIEVLDLIWEGKTNKEIGDMLDISLSTTKYHVSNIFTKLNVRSRTQIFALKHT